MVRGGSNDSRVGVRAVQRTDAAVRHVATGVGFSSGILTIVFACYMVGLVGTLIVAGVERLVR